MDDPRHFENVLHAIAEAWALQPDLRLGQLLLNALRPVTDCRVLLSVENEELIRLLRAERGRMRSKPDAPSAESLPENGLFETMYEATPAEWKEYWNRRQSLVRGDDLDEWRAWWLRCMEGTSRYLRFRAYEWLWSDLTWNFDRERLFSDAFLRENAVLDILRHETDFRREAYLARIGMRDTTAVEEIHREIETASDQAARRLDRLLKVDEHLSRGEHPWLRSCPMLLPSLGDCPGGAVILDLIVEVGTWIRQGEDILELETEKAIIEVPSPLSGRIREWTVQPGETVVPGQQLCVIEMHR